MHTRPSLKSLIELKISEKIPTAFQSKKISKSYFSRTGIKEIDSLLDGIPYGEFTEITGETSCGSTTLVLSFLAEITQKQQLGAFVDPSNSLDIESCSTVGINLNQLLWVRFGQKEQKLWEKLEQALKVTDLLLHNRGFGAVVLDLRGLPINFPQRIPPTTWFRFSQIVRDSETALVLLS
jgi:RecA/RadA recombinase